MARSGVIICWKFEESLRFTDIYRRNEEFFSRLFTFWLLFSKISGMRADAGKKTHLLTLSFIHEKRSRLLFKISFNLKQLCL